MSSPATTASFYTECVAELGSSNVEDLMFCMTEKIHNRHQQTLQFLEGEQAATLDSYIIVAAALVFFMQAGFAMVVAGSVRKKSLQNTMLKNLLDACGSAIAFYCIGYAFAFGDGSNPNAFIGTTNFFLQNVENYAFWFFQYTFSAASATIVAGALAERCKMNAYFYYSLFLSGLVYPVVAHAFWSSYGFLSPLKEDPLFGSGAIDLAGGAVVHLTGGLSALIATYILGPRRGRFHDEQTGEELDEPRDIPGHSVSLQLIGTLILWFGWFGFNPGAALLTGSDHFTTLAGLAAANTSIAAGSAGVVVLFLNVMLVRRETGKTEYNIVLAMNGVLSGLVSITAGCFVMETWAALATGAIAAVIHLYGQRFVVWLRLDDAVDAIPIHCFNGMWGIIAIGLFANPDRVEQTFGITNQPGLLQSIVVPGVDISGSLLGAQIVGLLAVIAWITVTMLPFFVGLNALGLFRSSAQDEVTGLDDVFHGVLRDENGDQILTAAQLEELKKRVEKKLEEELPAPPMEVMVADDEDLSM